MTRLATKIVLAGVAMAFAAPLALAQGLAAGQTAAAQSATANSAPKRGFFVGLQSGLISDSGLAPVVAGYQGQLSEEGRWSVTASGYYMYQTDWSIGTYLGGGFGAFNLPQDAAPGLTSSSYDFGYQGMAGVTYQFSPTMTLGVEYRYLGQVDQWSARSLDTTLKDEAQSVSLRFDYSF
jgi:opacity protein-like surface antigen